MTPVRRLLLVDDNDDQRSSLADALRARGWEVEVAHRGQRGLELAARSKPDVVISELILPDTCGFRYARAVREVVEHELFVIAVTRVPPELHGRALRSGFDHVQPKPLDVDDLHERMLRMTITWPRANTG